MARVLTEEDYAWARTLGARFYWWCCPHLREDALQEACLALLRCAPAYDPRCGTFKNYAFPRIRGAIIDMLRRHFGDPRDRNSRKAYARHQLRKCYETALEIAEIDARDTIEAVRQRFGPTCHKAVLACGEFKATPNMPKQTLYDRRRSVLPLLVSLLA